MHVTGVVVSQQDAATTGRSRRRHSEQRDERRFSSCGAVTGSSNTTGPSRERHAPSCEPSSVFGLGGGS